MSDDNYENNKTKKIARAIVILIIILMLFLIFSVVYVVISKNGINLFRNITSTNASKVIENEYVKIELSNLEYNDETLKLEYEFNFTKEGLENVKLFESGSRICF